MPGPLIHPGIDIPAGRRYGTTSYFKTHWFVILSVAKDLNLLKMLDSSLRYASFRMTNLKIMGF
jgi:hypothetical protein